MVSDDLAAGQHSPPASQAPLDGIVRVRRGESRLDASASHNGPKWLFPETRTLAAYKRASAKVAVQFPFEAALGKTRRTEF